MDFEYPKNLDKFIDLLRKKGVKTFKCEGIEIELTSEPSKRPYHKKSDGSELIEIDTPYQEEDALFWTSTGVV